MKKYKIKYKVIFIIISIGILVSLLFFSIKENFDTTYLLRDILYFPLTFESDKELVLEDRYLELNEELTSLKELLNINTSLSDFTTISSTVINRNTSYWNNELTINKGSLDNIERGMAVIDGNGLIGRIDKVGLTTSIVKLITNYDKFNKISVKVWINEESINKVLAVDSNNNLVISGIDNNTNLNIGDKVTTSGLSDIYPSGITIGTVEYIENDNFGISKKAYIKHVSNFDNLRYVMVLIRG